MSEYLDTMHKSCSELRNIAFLIGNFGEAFFQTGNDKMADSLTDISDRIIELEKKISAAVGKEINDQYQESLRGAANTVMAVLAANNLHENNDG